MKVYTIRDIAEMAGVSVTTVSRVLNHRPDVNQATRKKVEQIIRDCHFVGNSNARGLKQGNEVIGVVIRGRSNPFLSSLAEAIRDRADTVPENFVDCRTDDPAESCQRADLCRQPDRRTCPGNQRHGRAHGFHYRQR